MSILEQHPIVAKDKATATDHLEAEFDLQTTRSNRLRQATLTAAFSESPLPKKTIQKS
ncbi:MAG: hypothetical protein Q7Q71_16680 [Verrucomicrobiota bacterium JB023]|nr:hypothetical protein [Verrucomicrobiota bacterium JB023]